MRRRVFQGTQKIRKHHFRTETLKQKQPLPESGQGKNLNKKKQRDLALHEQRKDSQSA